MLDDDLIVYARFIVQFFLIEPPTWIFSQHNRLDLQGLQSLQVKLAIRRLSLLKLLYSGYTRDVFICNKS